jgi:hypothetical protein
LDIANTIAQNNATSLQISSVVSAEMPVTWLETVPIDREDRIGATMVQIMAFQLGAGLEEPMKLIVLMRLLP